MKRLTLALMFLKLLRDVVSCPDSVPKQRPDFGRRASEAWIQRVKESLNDFKKADQFMRLKPPPRECGPVRKGGPPKPKDRLRSQCV